MVVGCSWHDQANRTLHWLTDIVRCAGNFASARTSFVSHTKHSLHTMRLLFCLCLFGFCCCCSCHHERESDYVDGRELLIGPLVWCVDCTPVSSVLNFARFRFHQTGCEQMTPVPIKWSADRHSVRRFSRIFCVALNDDVSERLGFSRICRGRCFDSQFWHLYRIIGAGCHALDPYLWPILFSLDFCIAGQPCPSSCFHQIHTQTTN